METNKKFNAAEQRIEDILRTIDTIENVVDVIKSIYELSIKQENINEHGREMQGKIEAYEEMLASNLDDLLKQTLTSKKAKLEEEIQEGIWEYISLDDKIKELEEKLVEYINYANFFNYLTVEDAETVFSQLDDCDEKKFLTAIFLFTNDSVDVEIVKYLYDILIDEDIKEVLSDMLDSGEDNLINFIAEKEF